MRPAAPRRLPTLALIAASTLLLFAPQPAALGQDVEPELVRPAPPALEDFETDKNKDGVPDGWYNLRDGTIIAEGGVIGPHFLRFETTKTGRPSRLSRAFGVNGKKYEAIVVGLWVRLDQIQSGERVGEEPGLMIDFFGPKLRQTTRGTLGPWNVRTFHNYAGPRWYHVAKRIPVSPETLEAIMSVGLIGATGVLDIDGMTIELIPVGGQTTTNLVKNGDFELGDPEPFGWSADTGAHRSVPGYRSSTSLELTRSSSRVMTGLALPVDQFPSLAVSMAVKTTNLRGSGGAVCNVFFLDDNGRILPAFPTGATAFTWSGTSDWKADRAVVSVPAGAVRAVLQVEKTDGVGSIRIDNVAVSVANDPSAGSWTPYHVDDETDRWLPMPASTKIEPDSALDFSFLTSGGPARKGPVVVRDGRFHYQSGGGRARFFGVQLMPPAAFLDAQRADALADRLSRSGVNLVRIGELDTPLGPNRSLFDDTLDDTQHVDEIALTRLDHLIAALKSRGIYVALELQGGRRFRSGDGVASPGALMPGGGPVALFDPKLAKYAAESAKLLMNHVNPETKLAWKNEPALAWVTLAGEVSLFDLIDVPSALPSDYTKAYREAASKGGGTGRRHWQTLETTHWTSLAQALKKDGLKAPIAGVSHWRREKEFAEGQGAAGLDLVDDRIFWAGPPWIAPRFRSMMWSLDGGLIPEAARKRKLDKPYVLGQWCDFTQGVWAAPYEAAEQLLTARMALSEDWDALCRRGLFLFPEEWGSAAPGTTGGEDIYQVPEVVNAAPQVFALWPHSASILLRGSQTEAAAKGRAAPRTRKHLAPGWEPERGRLVVETAYTEGVAGWPGGDVVTLDNLIVDLQNTYGVVVASSVGPEPISKSKRLLVTAVARVQPTGFRWVDDWRRETADPGRPPLTQEPVEATVVWKGKTGVKGYVLDNNGVRVKSAKVETRPEGARLVIDGTEPSIHWELVIE